MPRVVALFGPSRGVVREVERAFTVGRANEADLQLIDDKVSREHCVLEPEAGGCQVRDLGSRNGTYLNGKRLELPARLSAGDHLGIGESVLVYEPSFEALLARDGASTLVLTGSPGVGAEEASSLSPAALERAGALALRAALAATPVAAAELLAAASQEALAPRGLAILLRTSSGTLHPLHVFPPGSQLSLSRPLLERTLREGRPLALREEQTEPETDDHTTRVRTQSAHVLCAPLFAQGEACGALCLTRDRAFDGTELALAGALAASCGPTFRAAPTAPAPEAELVAESPSMREALRLATQVSRTASTVLITGESGTGKEELAHAIHARGPRSAGPFIAVNCGAIPAELAESELFGHERGAFTGAAQSRPGVFEQADGGTLFLDEVGDLPLPLQVKLLRVLQDRRVTRVGGRAVMAVDVRVVAATHRDLEAAVKQGALREDLYWRLNVVHLHLLPLRERPEDVLPLAERFLSRLGRTLGIANAGLTPEATAALKRCAWPGNARQLANALERALVLRSEGRGPIGLADLPPEVLAAPPAEPGAAASGATLSELVRALEREQIAQALRRAKGVKSAAAEALGISRPTLDRKLEEYAIRLFE